MSCFYFHVFFLEIPQLHNCCISGFNFELACFSDNVAGVRRYHSAQREHLSEALDGPGADEGDQKLDNFEDTSQRQGEVSLELA